MGFIIHFVPRIPLAPFCAAWVLGLPTKAHCALPLNTCYRPSTPRPHPLPTALDSCLWENSVSWDLGEYFISLGPLR